MTTIEVPQQDSSETSQEELRRDVYQLYYQAYLLAKDEETVAKYQRVLVGLRESYGLSITDVAALEAETAHASACAETKFDLYIGPIQHPAPIRPN